MRVVIIVPGGVDRSEKEGVIPAVLWLIERLTRQHQVTVVALRQYPQPCRYSLLGAEVINLGNVPARFSKIKTIINFKRLLSVLNDMPKKPQVLHAFWAGEPGFLAALAGKWMSIPVLLSIGGGELVWIPEIGYGGLRSPIAKYKIKLSLRSAAKITAGSKYALSLIHKGAPSQHWLPLGVDCSVFKPPSTRPRTPPYRLIQAANLNLVKNQTMLFQALSILRQRLPDIKLDLLGGDLLGGKLSQVAEELGIGNQVRFHGQISPGALLPHYQNAHLYVQSSLHESQGVAVCEAAATSLPIIGTAVGLVPELAPQAAISVPIGDAGALADRIESLLCDPEHCQRLGTAAYKWAHTYDADWTAREFERLYQQLASAV